MSTLIQRLLSKPVQSFIQTHWSDDPKVLLLKHKAVNQVPVSIIVDQIAGKKKAKDKLPTWYDNEQIVYPPSINLEQSSSEQAALNKRKLVEKEVSIDPSTASVLDLTGGFGVDSYAFSKTFKEVLYVEPNKDLLEITRHNHRQLGTDNIIYYNSTAEQFLVSLPTTKVFDLTFIDPSRRSPTNRKVFSFNQCDPDVTILQDKMWHLSERLLVKASPLLDLEQALRELKHVKKIFIVSIHNECKELLFYCERGFDGEPVIVAINLNRQEDSISFKSSDERSALVKFHDPLQILYEPNASLLKSGGFKIIASIFNIYKLHPNTHLYTSEKKVDGFPGRVFRIETYVKPDPKKLKIFFPDQKANILTRNYPLSVDELRKKTHLKEGGNKFLIACSGLKKKFLIVATKLNGL